MSGLKSQPSKLLNGGAVSVTLFLFCAFFVSSPTCLAVDLNAGQTGSDGSAAPRLAPGQTVERELKGGEAHTHIINLRQGEFLHVLVEQQGVNVVMTLRNRAGAKLVEVDLLDEYGPEPVSFEATAGGDYLLEVRPVNATVRAGRYSVMSSVKPRATAEDRTRMGAERLLIEAEELFRSGGAANLRRALAKMRQSLAVWRRLDDRYWVASTLNAVGVTYNELGVRQKALESYEEALSLRRSIGDRPGEARTLNNLASNYAAAGQKQQAIEFLKQAAAAYRAAGHRFQEAAILNDIGLAYADLDDARKALDFYSEALSIFKGIGDRLGEADVLNNIGTAYHQLKDQEKALDYYKQALSLYEANGGRGEQANTLVNLGNVYEEAGDRKKALEYYDRAVAHSRAVGDREQEVKALGEAGDVSYQLGERQKVLDYYNQALPLLRKDENRAGEANFLSSIGYVYNDLGEWQKAVEYYERALKLYRADGNGRGEADALKTIGDIYYTRDKKKAIGYYLQLSRLKRAAKDYKGEAETLRNIGFLYDDLRQWRNAFVFLGRTLAIYKAAGDRGGEADTLTNIGSVYYRQNKMPEALKYYEQALLIYDMEKPGWGKGRALNNVGLVAHHLGDWQKSLEYYGRSLPLFSDADDKKGEADTLINMGLIYAYLGEQQKALEYYQQSLALRRKLGDAEGEADALTNIGVSYRAIDDDRKALDSFEQALKLRRAAGDKYGQANALTKVAETYHALGEYRKALEHYQQVLPLMRTVKDRDGETLTLFMLGGLSLMLDEPRPALTYLKQVQAIARAGREKALEAFILTFTGLAYLELKQEQTAFAQFDESLRLFKAEGFTLGQAWTLFLIGATYEESKEFDKAIAYYQRGLTYMKASSYPKLEAEMLMSIGDVYAATGKRAEALDAYARTLTLRRTAKDTPGEASVLDAIGDVYKAQGEQEKAAGYYAGAVLLRQETTKAADGLAPLESRGGTYDSLGERKEEREHFEYYLESIQRAKARGLPGPEAEALSRAMGTIMDQVPGLAIILGKQAIEKFQESRSNLDRHTLRLAEDTYLRSFSSTCRDLADLLIEKGRLFEAQQVLAMLKETEYSEYVRRDGAEAAALSQRADLRPEERKMFAEYSRIFDKLTTISSRWATLNARKKDPLKAAPLSSAEDAELLQLGREVQKANEAFESFIGYIKTEFDGSGRNLADEIKENVGLQSDLKKWGNGTVVLHTFVGPKRYRIILTTPRERLDGKTEITAAELNRKIMAFRRTLMDPAIDPRPQAQELYDILLRPIEKHLEGANVRTLVWSLDGALRYLPLAALHDGRQYMVERYQQAVITLASRTRLSDPVRNGWRGLGLGVSAQWGTFSALPAVVGELESIIRDEDSPGVPTTAKAGVLGVLPGRRLLDKNFTAQSFADALGRDFSLIHIASHFSFSPGGAEKSFLLLGDGNRLTLKTMATAPEYNLAGVELLTLSACNTGIDESGGEAEQHGNEVENFGVIAQRRGAKAVIATLWEVGDDSTRSLMREFYRIHSTTPDITKAEALRRAQLTLLNGDPTAAPSDARTRRAELAGLNASKLKGPPFRISPEKPYAHPYYWAPFILIGNWR